jgi:hypothetical protein
MCTKKFFDNFYAKFIDDLDFERFTEIVKNRYIQWYCNQNEYSLIDQESPCFFTALYVVDNFMGSENEESKARMRLILYGQYEQWESLQKSFAVARD